ncbi:hypothetical protein AQUCO_01700366v1 [Aquilegia coerulea]|uniref:KIB1-4 beta-propeller domain-containing protein n=1 Tax=Aquilegia coerulea TaxID=218851 RepID=A0A2G5DMI5_AQUCA|nr:hypothetical protein AQUCO_01700366v1 [Aquilegia coerulea]
MAFEDIKDIGFFSLRDNKIYQAELPELVDRRICGSFPGGWLMTVHENSEIQLFHPFSVTKQVIHLPPLTQLPCVLQTEIEDNNELFYIGTRFDRDELFCYPSKYVRDVFIQKVAMSSSRVAAGTIIMAIQSINSSLAYYKVGGDQNVWTPVSTDMSHCFFRDLAYYKGRFYAVHNNGYVVVVHGLEEEVSSNIFVEQVIAEPTGKLTTKLYIVESRSDLLVVVRFIRTELSGTSKDIYELWRCPHRTVGFRVLKLEFGAPNNKWVEVESLGDCSLFLGYNMSFSVSSSNLSGCKANCIYFTDDKYLFKKNFGGYDMGIFHLEGGGSIDNFLYPSDHLVVLPPPIWLAPNPS